MAEDVLFVRLREYKPKSGQSAKSRGFLDPVSGRPYQFRILPNGERPWYRVPRRIGEKLREMRVDPYAEGSPRCFEVCEETEARDLDAQAQEVREAKKAIEEPTVDTALDLTRGETRGDLKSEDVAPPSRAEAMAAATTPAAKPKAAAKKRGRPKGSSSTSKPKTGRRRKGGR
jgi:hypothetical protein